MRRVGAEAARIDAEHVDRRLALDDPLGELPAGAAGGGDAEAVALVEPEIPQAPGRADDRAAVGRVGDGAVIDLLDPDLAEGGNAGDRRLDMRRETVEILLEQLVLAVLGRPVEIAGGRALLVGAEEQAAVLLAHVPGRVELAEDAHLGQARGTTGEDGGVWLGDDVLVLDRQHRHVEPDHGAGAAGEIAGGRDDMLGDDVALVGADQPFAGGQRLDRRDGGVAVDFGAERAGAPGEGLGEVGGLDVAVVGVLDGAEKAVSLAERPDRLDLVRRQHVDLDADRPRHAGVIHVLVPAVAGAGEADVGDFPEADILAGLGLEPVVECDRVFVDLAHRVGQVEQRQQPRRMPGRARGQLAPLDEHDVRPALLRQVIEGGDADDASADDHRAGVGFHGTHRITGWWFPRVPIIAASGGHGRSPRRRRGRRGGRAGRRAGSDGRTGSSRRSRRGA